MLFLILVIGLAATKPEEDKIYKNLKVLSKKTTHDEMEKIMHDFNKDLGVKCNFCHARGENGKLNFASDEKPEKDIARDMMKMTIQLNRKYFHVKRPAIGDTSSIATCYTCHHGNAHIEDRK